VVLLDGEAETLTRRAVELALAGDPWAKGPRYRAGDEGGHPALAAAVITPDEAGTITAVVDSFVRTIETGDFERRLKIVEADLPGRRGDGRGMSDAGNAGYSIYR
jgi:hypothetical protein